MITGVKARELIAAKRIQKQWRKYKNKKKGIKDAPMKSKNDKKPAAAEEEVPEEIEV